MTRKICFILLVALAVAHAEDQPVKSAKKKATTAPKTATPPPELKLPKEAVLVEPNTYTFTDAKGKKWIYRKTPFGLSRAEEKPSAAPETPAPPPGAGMTATAEGDTIHFERPSPFGVYRWDKKKADLTDDERAALERSQSSPETAKAKQE